MGQVARYAVVTGGSSGIGREICRQLSREGWTVAVADINAEAGEVVVSEIRKAGGQAIFERLDVTDEAAWSSLRDRLQSEWPHIDLVVNNAGVCAGGALDDITVETWDWIYQINLRGAMMGCRTFIPWLKQNPRQTHIMNMSSIAGLVFAPRMAAYNATKAALVALSETLNLELKPDKVSVTAVCPWFVPTNLLVSGRFARKSEQDYAISQMKTSTVTPEHVAKQAIKATLKRKPVCIVGSRAIGVAYLNRMLPGVMRFMINFWSQDIEVTEEAPVDGSLLTNLKSEASKPDATQV
ncbi:MAG: SDR family NAD(P)-dependent oxidoreductase [Planctomycetaceae bacterium]|nr:SDR family NAD(P)-dependent oxidoreductase [Planctomycetaceae bacterium]